MAVVLVVDDHPIVRRGLCALLGAEDWVAQVVQASSIREAKAAAITVAPAVAVLDLGLPDGDGRTLVAYLRRAVPACRILVLTMTGDEPVVRACLAAGATGFVLKDTDPGVIVGAVRAVLDGGLVLGPRVSVAAVRASTALAPPLDRLSPTEIRILGLVGRGARNAEIAAALGVSEKTVRNRLTAVLGAIGATDRVHAALLARDAGLHLTEG